MAPDRGNTARLALLLVLVLRADLALSAGLGLVAVAVMAADGSAGAAPVRGVVFGVDPCICSSRLPVRRARRDQLAVPEGLFTVHDDAGLGHSVAVHELEERGGVRGGETHAAMRTALPSEPGFIVPWTAMPPLKNTE